MGLLSKATSNSFASEQPTDLLEKEITAYHEKYNEINCIVFKGNSELHNNISRMINTIGTVVPLAPLHQLILLPPSQDRELIAHRLSKILNTLPSLSFADKNPESLTSRIKNLL